MPKCLQLELAIASFHFQSKLEAEVSRLKAKVASLQIDLDNSEAVQRDFVKLSQSLQVMYILLTE